MIEIGIFDDETDQNMITDLVDTYMKEKKVPYIIYTYKTGKQLLESGKMFHLVFLNISSMILNLEKGESVSVHIPYMLNQVSFTDKYWKNIEQKEAGITVSLYPVKRYMAGI